MGKKAIFVIMVLAMAAAAYSLSGQLSPSPTDTPTAAPIQEENITNDAQPDAVEPSLQIPQAQYQPGETIIVSFTAPAHYAQNAWVGIVPASTNHGSEDENDAVTLVYESIGGRTQAVIEFKAPRQPGSYDIRMFDTRGNGQEVISINFEVAALPPEPDVSCNGISLSYDKALAAGVTCEVVPAISASDQTAPWDIAPEYVRLIFDSYLLQNTFHEAKVYLYPVEEFEAVNDGIGGLVAELQQLLVDRPENPESIPFLPILNAAQMIRTNVIYADFQNGSGVRFLTQYAQAALPINNKSLFYTFQGLTSDGRYYVAAIFPVSHPDLPAADDEVPNGNWDAFYNTFESDTLEMQTEINAWLNGSFTPNLELLDELIRSIKVDR